jgi:hypothetical protein
MHQHLELFRRLTRNRPLIEDPALKFGETILNFDKIGFLQKPKLHETGLLVHRSNAMVEEPLFVRHFFGISPTVAPMSSFDISARSLFYWSFS